MTFLQERQNRISNSWPSRNRRGFTLIEMIVATFLLAIVFVAIAETFNTVTRANSKSEAFQTSGLLARKRFAEVEQQADSLSGGDTEGNFGDEYPGFRWRQSVVATDFEKLFKVTVEISRGSNLNEKYEYVTYFSTDQNKTDDQIRQQQAAQNPGGSGDSGSPSSSATGGGANGG